MEVGKQRIWQQAATALRRSRVVTGAFFGFAPAKGDRIQWDLTTLALRKALLTTARAQMRIFEIGTGPYALLPLFLESRRICTIHACDINEAYVRSAQATVRERGSSVRVFQSDIFSEVRLPEATRGSREVPGVLRRTA